MAIIALACGVFAIVFKRVCLQGEVVPQEPKGEDGKDGVSVIKEAGDLTGEDIVKLFSTLKVIDIGKGTVIKYDGYFDVD